MTSKSKPMLSIPPESTLVNAEGRQKKLDARKGARKLSRKEAEEKTRNTPLLVPPLTASPDAPTPGIDMPGIHPVRIENIRPYKNNPRKEANPERENIKAHILAELELGHPPPPLTVSRRPDAERQLVEVDAGGNTRLAIYHEIWAETKHPLLERLFVVYRDWTGEPRVLANHLGENTQHGTMSYWDLATGFMQLKREIEDESGKRLSLREFVEKLPSLGVPRSLNAIAFYEFAASKLSGLGDSTSQLSYKSVRQIQPKYRSYAAVWKKRGQPESDFGPKVFSPACQSYAKKLANSDSEFEASRLLTHCESQLARALGISVADVRHDIDNKDPAKTASTPALPPDPFPPPPPPTLPASEPVTTPTETTTNTVANNPPLTKPPATAIAPSDDLDDAQDTPPADDQQTTESLQPHGDPVKNLGDEWNPITAESTLEQGKPPPPHTIQFLIDIYRTWTDADLRQTAGGYAQYIAFLAKMDDYVLRSQTVGIGYEMRPLADNADSYKKATWFLLDAITGTHGSGVSSEELPQIAHYDPQAMLAGLTYTFLRMKPDAVNNLASIIVIGQLLRERAQAAKGGAS